jgi:hypothetical protein
MIRHLWRGAIVLVASLIILSCAPKPRQELVTEEKCVPVGLTLDSTASSYALIAWNPGCPGLRILRGFNIYVSPIPLTEKYPGNRLPDDVHPYNGEIYPGDTLGNPQWETYAIEDLDNATQYYVHVRDLYTDGTLSPPSNELPLVVYARGAFTLAPSFTGDHDGFDFSAAEYCRADAPENDIYFYNKDNEDFLCSPARLGPVNRDTKIYSVGTGAPPKDWAAMKPDDKFTDRASIRKGAVYILITADGYPVKLEVESATGNDDDRKITFDYIYKPPVKNIASAG